MILKTVTKLPILFLMALALAILPACGGEVNSPAVQEVAVTFSLNGDAATTVGAVDLDITLPDNCTLETDVDNQPTAASLSSLVAGALSATNYTPKTGIVSGVITVGIVKEDGFPGDADLMQLTCTLTDSGGIPTKDDFLAAAVVSDLDGADIPGIAVNVHVAVP